MTQFGRPVLAVPTSPLELRLSALMRFQTHSARRAVYRRVMRWLMRLGFDHWFAEDADSPIDPATGFDFNGWLEHVRGEIGQPGATAAVMWPSESYRKRVYVHLFDRDVRPIGFAKLAMNEDNNRRLEREAEVLRELTAMSLRHSRVPRVLADSAWQGRRYLILEPVPEGAGQMPGVEERFPREVVDEYAGAARMVPGERLRELSWWGAYQERLEPGHGRFAAELEALVRDGAPVRRVHGDFGRHNTVLIEGRPWVFDWEESCEDGPAATDEVTYWTTAHLRDIMTHPRTFARLFGERFVRGASRERRRDVMMVLAFRCSRGMSSASAIVRYWGVATGESGAGAAADGAATYREVFAPRGKAEEYERDMCERGGYAEVLWRVEREQLSGVIEGLRGGHARLESLDFAAGTGRITRFVEGRVDASTAIEISPAMIEVARTKLTSTTVLCMDVTAPGAAIEGSYDLITAFRFIANAEPSLRLSAMRALAARLRDRTSRLVFNNHSHLPSHKLLMWPLHRLRRRGKGWTPDGNYMTDGQVRVLADRAGLEIVGRKGCGLLSGRVARLLGVERAARWERRLAAVPLLARLGGNQMYVARLKPGAEEARGAGAGGAVALNGAPAAAVMETAPGAGAVPEKREAHRAAVRIVTNYVRLGLNLALGLAFVPFMLHWIGERALGVIFLLGAGVGVAAMFREITTRSVIRELGAAYHTGDEAHFRKIYNSSLTVSLAMACIAAYLFAWLYFCVPYLDIPDHYDNAARVMVASQAVYIFITTSLSPVFNMLVVTERFVRYNLWVLAERSTMLLAAVTLYYLLGPAPTRPQRAAALSDWSMLVAALQCAIFLVPVGLMVLRDARLRPSPARVTREGVQTVSKTLGLYVAVEFASAMYEKVGQLIVNPFFGLVGNTIFGIAYQFVSYVRQATVGVTFGLDAVSARLSAAGQRPLRALMHHSTRLHGLVALPTGAAMFLLAEPLIRLWVGHRLHTPEEHLPPIVMTVRIMAVSMTARAIAEGWTTILYGAGFLRRYAPLVLAGGIIFPPLVISLLRTLHAGPEHPPTMFVVPATFASMHLAIYLLMLPWVAARCIGVGYGQMFGPLWRPAMVTVLSSGVLVFLPRWLGHDPAHPGLVALGATAVAFGAIYGLLSMALVLTGLERQRFVWGPLRRLTG